MMNKIYIYTCNIACVCTCAPEGDSMTERGGDRERGAREKEGEEREAERGATERGWREGGRDKKREREKKGERELLFYTVEVHFGHLKVQSRTFLVASEAHSKKY